MVGLPHGSRGHIVVIDDDREMCALLEEFLSGQGYQVSVFGQAAAAFQILAPVAIDLGPGVDLVISDIRMPRLDGLDLTARLRQIRPDLPVILITAFGSIETAVEAMRRGAFHYIVKPFKLTEIAIHVERALEHLRLRLDNQALRDAVRSQAAVGRVLGKSRVMQPVFELMSRCSQVMAPVLLTGESGTGKELVARVIHEESSRAAAAFVSMSCTAVPEVLLEAELFGHSLSGGVASPRGGLLAQARGGTVFLEEVGDMGLNVQARLVRFLEQGGERSSDVRVIAATRKDLKLAMREGRFREDLYYRLSVIPVSIPPLRHRSEDIPILVKAFFEKAVAANQRNLLGIQPAALQKLMRLAWPGNVRELENLVERLVVLSAGPWITELDVPSALCEGPEEFFASAASDFPTIAELEKRYMQLVLDKTAGRKDQAAQILGINRRTLYRKEREYGWVEGDFPTASPLGPGVQ